MKKRSPLDTLKDLRERALDSEKLRLAAKVRESALTLAEAERARQVLVAARHAADAARSIEKARLEGGALTAAEGQQRIAWERVQRQRDAKLAGELSQALESHRGAVVEHERAAHEVERADVAVEQVQGRITRAENVRQRAHDAAQQELVDEASLRRFMERSRS